MQARQLPLDLRRARKRQILECAASLLGRFQLRGSSSTISTLDHLRAAFLAVPILPTPWRVFCANFFDLVGLGRVVPFLVKLKSNERMERLIEKIMLCHREMLWNFPGTQKFFPWGALYCWAKQGGRMPNPTSFDERRHLSPLLTEERPDHCRRHHLDECRGAEPVRAGEAHSRGRQISGPSKRWAAMYRLRPVRGPGFMQGRGGSGRRERLVPTLHGEARLGLGFHSRDLPGRVPRRLASRPGHGVDVRRT